MTQSTKTAAITGARGYVGGLVRDHLEAHGWRTVALVRHPRPDDTSARHFDLAEPIADGLLEGIDILIHCAYDLRLTSAKEVFAVNVEGSRQLLRSAASVPRVLTVSSMSAYQGTTQLYGRAKLAIEAATFEIGGGVVRPGLVHGPRPGGMTGALIRMLRAFPVVPVVGGRSHQFLVHEEDLVAMIGALAATPVLPAEPIGLAHPDPVPFRAVLERFARADGLERRLLPVPWRPAYWALRGAEAARLPVPFRADSLLGLVRPAPALPGAKALADLGVTPRPFREDSG